MKTENSFCLFFDDDAVLVNAINALLQNFFKEKGMDYELGMSVSEAKEIIEKNKTKKLFIGILDIWLNDKNTFEHNENAGFEIFHLLREKWPDSYIIFFSGHIDEKVREKLKNEPNVGIIGKPVSTSTLFSTIEKKLAEIKEMMK